MSSASVERDDTRFKILVAILLSLLLHMLIIGGVAVVALEEGKAKKKEVKDDKPLEIVLIPPPAQAAPKPQFIDSADATVTDKAPEKPAFESDQNTMAASEQPAAGTLPIPTQEGRDDQSLDFANRNYTPGKLDQPPAPPTPQTQPQQAKPEQQQQPSEAKPVPKPQTELALLDPPKPKTETPKPKTEQVEKPQPQIKNTLPGFQPEKQVTRLKGNLSNRGKSSAAANATPLGRYKKMVNDAIGSRWYYYVTDRMDMLTIGTVDARFIIDPSGKVEKVQVLRNTSNEIFAATCVRSITEAEFPPFPPDVGKVLEGGRMEVDFSFTIMSN